MTRKPPRSLQQMAAESAGNGQPMQIGGKPADKCPHCGAGMFVDKTQATGHQIVRYIQCRKCNRRFVSSQPPARLVRELDADNSADGKPHLTLVRQSA